MTDYHTTYTRPEGESTQWEDIQRRLGNLPAKASGLGLSTAPGEAHGEPAPKPESFAPEEDQRTDAEFLDIRDEGELEELEDEFADDRFLAEYRRKRLEELRRGRAAPRFGSLEEIRGSEFVAKVTHAGEGVWVVCHLYKAAAQDCGILNQCLGELARQYPGTKFVKIVSTDCIPSYPDENLPTVLLYRDTKCLQTLVGLRQFGGRETSPDQVAISLNRFGDVCGDVEEQRERLKSLLGRLVERREEERHEQQQDEDSDF
eukprot:scaffold2.g7331.t1